MQPENIFYEHLKKYIVAAVPNFNTKYIRKELYEGGKT